MGRMVHQHPGEAAAQRAKTAPEHGAQQISQLVPQAVAGRDADIEQQPTDRRGQQCAEYTGQHKQQQAELPAVALCGQGHQSGFLTDENKHKNQRG